MKLYGLIGHPVKHSLSAVMHNAAFKKTEGFEDAEYHLFDVIPDKLRDFLLNQDEKFKDTEGRTIRAGDVIGFNITIPHKVKARQILEEKSSFETSSRILEDLYYVKLSGAVNTVRRDSDGLKYWNTDASGFLRSVEADLQFDIVIENVFVIGCGGAARAIIASLSWKECKIPKIKIKKIYVYDINGEAINSAREHFATLSQKWQKLLKQKVEFITQEQQIHGIVRQCQLLVNASPVGMKDGDPSVIDKDLLHKDLYVYDVVYNKKTQLIQDAEQKCKAAIGGESMLLYQGAHAFNFWTGEPPPTEIMKQALEEELNPKG